VLHDRLVGDAEGTASCVGPICRIKTYRVLLESFACGAEGQEAFCIEIGEYEDEDVQRQVGDG
jgi:hypothetical protein